MTSDAASGYTVSEYLLDRLAELGVRHAFGVPGDYTLGFLDHVVAHQKVEWVGCTNELNAGYAADAYGRLRGAAALFTTFGVGELSAVNALAGSFAEFVPVVEVVGAPASTAQAAHRIVHHSLGDGVFDHFLAMHEPVTCARAALTGENAAAEIDRVLVASRDQRLPAYLLLPADVAETPAAPPTTPLPPPVEVTDPVVLQQLRAAAARLFATVATTRRVTVLAGLLVHRLGAVDRLQALIDSKGVTFATSMWAKSAVDESRPGFAGVYAGAASDPAARAAVEDAGVLVVAGVQYTDLNSGFFTQALDRRRTIELSAATASVGDETFEPVSLPDALSVLDDLLADVPLPTDANPYTAAPGLRAEPATDPDAALAQDSLWSTVAASLREDDVVLADLGTSFFGMATRPLPHGATFLGQPLWAAIGYTVPALLGASLARPESRAVLLVGDGAALMTVQELATIARQGLTPVAVVVDNDGYTVERAIHGAEQAYNDIPRVDWTGLARALAPDADPAVARVTTVRELADVLAAARSGPPRFTLVQAVLPRLDVPALLTTIAQAAATANRPATVAP